MEPQGHPHFQHLNLVALSYSMAGSICGVVEGTVYAFRELVPHSLADLRHLVQVSMRLGEPYRERALHKSPPLTPISLGPQGSPRQHTRGAEATLPGLRLPSGRVEGAVLREQNFFANLNPEPPFKRYEPVRLPRSGRSETSSNPSTPSGILSGTSTPLSELQPAAVPLLVSYITPEKPSMNRLGSYPIVFETDSVSSDQDSE